MGTNGCPQEALAARQRQSRQARPAAPGMPGAAPPDPGHGGEGAGDGRAGIMPPPGGPGAGSRAIVRCRARYRIPPGPGREDQPGRGARTSGGCRTAAGPGSRASGRRPRAAADAGAQPGKSAGTPPGDDDLDAAAAHPGRRQAARAARRATASARRPGHRARGHAARRPGERQGTAAGPAAPRAQTPDVAGPLRRRCPGLPTVSRLTGPDRQVVPSRHRRRSRSPWCSLSGR